MLSLKLIIKGQLREIFGSGNFRELTPYGIFIQAVIFGGFGFKFAKRFDEVHASAVSETALRKKSRLR
jgi:hypothetical protein